jgi:hypothetical protein
MRARIRVASLSGFCPGLAVETEQDELADRGTHVVGFGENELRHHLHQTASASSASPDDRCIGTISQLAHGVTAALCSSPGVATVVLGP